jgi:SAM-dependent methyltransferase
MSQPSNPMVPSAGGAAIESPMLPSDWMVRFAQLVAPGHSLLDVACGYGRHARYFAQRGVRVTAVDRDALALASFADVSGILTEQRDLEAPATAWPYAAESFDAVLVSNYLWRPTFDALLAAVKPGGLLLYETFMDGNERFGKPSRPEFLLRSNELLQRTRDRFRVIAFEEGEDVDANGQPVACRQRICAQRLSG